MRLKTCWNVGFQVGLPEKNCPGFFKLCPPWQILWPESHIEVALMINATLDLAWTLYKTSPNVLPHSFIYFFVHSLKVKFLNV